MDKEMNIKQKLMHIQTELKAPKNQRNTHGGFNYRSCEDILEAAKPLCAKYEVLLLLSDEIATAGGFNYVKATAAVMDVYANITDPNGTISSVAYAKEPLEHKGKDDSQATGSASSYARKYALNALFAIDDTKDADSDESAQEANSAPTAAQKKQEEKPLTLKEAYAIEVEVKGKTYTLGKLSEEQLNWLSTKAKGRTKEAITLIMCEKFKLSDNGEDDERPFE